MIYIDTILTTLINQHYQKLASILPTKDFNVLKSLANSVSGHFFITENQSRLLLKILRENQRSIGEFSEELSEALTEVHWSKEFRQIEQVRKFFITKNEDHEPVLNIEFTFNSEIRKIITNLTKTVENLAMVNNGKNYTAEFTEKNIVALVEDLTPLNFNIDPVIKNHYETIKSWSKGEVESQFLLTNIEHKNFQKAITDDLGIETSIDQNIINDRSMRYQYLTENLKISGENLTQNIANRSKPRYWVDKTQHTMTEIVASLIELKRLPILVVFDTIINNKYLENLKILSKSLEDNGIFDHIGIYFRLPNDVHGKQFNQFIAEKKYNYNLDESTSVACVQSGKLPKFFLKTAWKPMSVIALDSRMGLRHGKTAVYSNYCDLIVEWSDEPPLADIRIKG